MYRTILTMPNQPRTPTTVSSDQLATLGILYVILALILVSGKVIGVSVSRPVT